MCKMMQITAIVIPMFFLQYLTHSLSLPCNCFILLFITFKQVFSSDIATHIEPTVTYKFVCINNINVYLFSTV